MIEIEKKYILREITICVNKRIITYDYDSNRALYTYNGINKEEFKIDYPKWNKIVEKYKLYRDYSFSKGYVPAVLQKINYINISLFFHYYFNIINFKYNLLTNLNR